VGRWRGEYPENGVSVLRGEATGRRRVGATSETARAARRQARARQPKCVTRIYVMRAMPR